MVFTCVSGNTDQGSGAEDDNLGWVGSAKLLPLPMGVAALLGFYVFFLLAVIFEMGCDVFFFVFWIAK